MTVKDPQVSADCEPAVAGGRRRWCSGTVRGALERRRPRSHQDMTSSEQQPIDVRRFWKTLGERATGMTLVTAKGRAGPVGFVGLSAAHVSADPPLLLVSVDRKTSALQVIAETGAFAINYLAAGQRALADLFGRRTEDYDQRFASPDWNVLETGAPVLSTALGAFDCRVENTIEVPGTVIFIGRAVAAFAAGAGEPLVFFRGNYRA